MPAGTSRQPTMMETTSQAPTVNNSGRLKYADPRDLPSYPSSGLRSDGAAAGAAASLGWSNRKTIETWKPDKTSSASAAAVLAKNYKMAPAWEPTSTSASAQAALLAAGSASSTNKAAIPRSPQTAGWGSSAATQAFNSNRSNSMRTNDYTTPTASSQGQRSLAAAKGAMSGTRPRATSTPTAPRAKESYPGESLAASNALSGATLAHRASVNTKPPVENAGAVPITTMTRNMFTSHPPVKPETDEKEYNEKIHATAVAMARKMYMQQQKMVDQAKETHGQDSEEPKPYINLQDAAFKQAQERLAKLYDEHQKNRDIQEYYGNTSSPRRRFSITSKLRRRASSDGDLDDRQQSEKIRQQMSMFSDKITQVDEKKRQKDREAVLAAAQRNVKAQLQGMDQKVYNETGKVNPTMMSEWELKAQQVAQINHESRSQNKGKVDIGGGKFMDPHDVNIIAAKRVQPVLDDINTKAELERERLAVAKMEEETRKAELEKQKARDREVKEIHRKLREQEREEERAKKQQEKQEEKLKKDEEKAIKAEQKRLAKEEKKKAKAQATAAAATTAATTHDESSSDSESVSSEEHHETQRSVETPATTAINTDAGNMDDEHRKATESATSPTSKVKGWIKNRFSKGKSGDEGEKQGDKGKGFVGGAALRDPEMNNSTTSLDNRPTSMRDVALAGKNGDSDAHEEGSRRDSQGVSPVSSKEDVTEAPVGNHGEFLLHPPKPIQDSTSRLSSPTRDSRFREMMDS